MSAAASAICVINGGFPRRTASDAGSRPHRQSGLPSCITTCPSGNILVSSQADPRQRDCRNHQGRRPWSGSLAIVQRLALMDGDQSAGWVCVRSGFGCRRVSCPEDRRDGMWLRSRIGLDPFQMGGDDMSQRLETRQCLIRGAAVEVGENAVDRHYGVRLRIHHCAFAASV